jgi:hypothetical protein
MGVINNMLGCQRIGFAFNRSTGGLRAGQDESSALEETRLVDGLATVTCAQHNRDLSPDYLLADAAHRGQHGPGCRLYGELIHGSWLARWIVIIIVVVVVVLA